MKKIDYLRKHLKEGRVYRREDLNAWSKSVDRHLQQLVSEGVLDKLAGGLYYAPYMTAIGKAPPKEQTLLRCFLKDKRFLIMSPNYYNTLGVGTTQLYNDMWVYNYKRHGEFEFGEMTYNLVKKQYIPREITQEFLLVDMVNNINYLAEDVPDLLSRIERRSLQMNKVKLLRLAHLTGTVATKKFFNNILNYKDG